MSEILYTTSATTFGGLDGKVESADGVINFGLSGAGVRIRNFIIH